jgi:hypothetical protein
MKYGAGLSSFSREFLERMRCLDELRGAQRDLVPYTASRKLPPNGRAEAGRVYYLLDASAVAHIYVADDDLTPKLDHFIEQKGLGRAFLMVPNFCIAETFNTLAKLHYRSASLDDEQYRLCREAFTQDIHNGQLLYHYELNRYHVLYIDHILPFEHLFETQRPKGMKKGAEWTLSTFDMLIISVGIELARMTGNSTYIPHLRPPPAQDQPGLDPPHARATGRARNTQLPEIRKVPLPAGLRR